MSLIFSQESIFHLYRLGLAVSEKSGKRYRLVNEKEMHALIRYCDRSKDSKVRQKFSAFLAFLSNNELLMLEASHLIKPQSAQLQKIA